MRLGEEGHATIEMLMLMPLILLILILVWITGELYYIKNRTILASKCLALHERQCYYDYLTLKNSGDQKSPDTYMYEGSEDLKAIYFLDKETSFEVARAGAIMASDINGASHLPNGRPSDYDPGLWESMVNIVSKARGATEARVQVSYKPVLFWPVDNAIISDTMYLAASDWRYAELPGGYIDLLRRKLKEIGGTFGPFGEATAGAVGKILKWIID